MSDDPHRVELDDPNLGRVLVPVHELVHELDEHLVVSIPVELVDEVLAGGNIVDLADCIVDALTFHREQTADDR